MAFATEKKSLLARFVYLPRDLDSAKRQYALVIRLREVIGYQEKLSMQVIVSKKKRKPVEVVCPHCDTVIVKDFSWMMTYFMTRCTHCRNPYLIDRTFLLTSLQKLTEAHSSEAEQSGCDSERADERVALPLDAASSR